ncbi:hypothetical protein [Dongshaea marina]|uniref:hypothetical protein n=1 Tax=Dongshaea marina TaxID=2047966 RepID=UPI000D3E8F77|nr:hypothetical protein [Dongshaea marina]
MVQAVISGSGFVHGEHGVTSKALVESFNRYVDLYNEENSSAIDAGRLQAREYSTLTHIEQHYGIEHRYFVTSEGVLDPEVMQPLLSERPEHYPSLPAELAVSAAEQALEQAECDPSQIELVIVASSEAFRLAPQLAAEVQHFLGAPAMATILIWEIAPG